MDALLPINMINITYTDLSWPIGTVLFPRVWSMPSHWTFTMEPIKQLLESEVVGAWIDPFAGNNSPARVTNDINQKARTIYHMDALKFLRTYPTNASYIDGVLFDPPYSAEQARRIYKVRYKGTAGLMEYLAECKDEIARIIRPGGKVISFGWNSAGIGSIRGFQLVRGLLLNHGTRHDTIVTVEVKQ